ncbi:REP-associated tyrosine transposase [Aliidiomarina celeris]|uniref:REP-associated tyrosine transposase n=1 Tax=Aliidiomarina celeris TaxID=2249428 RepID=UPI000DEB7BAA|nr:transposase [Aliidiomarina celeris]
MARRKRVDIPGFPYHIVQRGNNKQNCFADSEDFSFYAHLMKIYKEKFNVDIHAWVFMTNHVHMLVTPHEKQAVSKMMQSIGRRYVQRFNKKRKRTGTLWEGRFHSSIVDSDEYLLTVYRYIELNPVRAGMVNTPNEHHWSSFATNGYGRRSNLITPHELYLGLGESEEERLKVYRSLFMHDVKGEVLQQIRTALQANIAFGGEKFKKTIELATGISQHLKTPKNKGSDTQQGGQTPSATAPKKRSS